LRSVGGEDCGARASLGVVVVVVVVVVVID
jgi:hypothetical protein